MGRKATFLYFHFISVLFTFAFAAFTIVVGVCSHNNPNQGFILPLLGLGMMPILFFNLLIFIYWSLRWKIWVLIPVIAIAANHEYISAKYQFPSSEQLPITNNRLIKIANFNVESFHGYPSVYSTGEIKEFMEENHIDVFCLQEFSESSFFNVDSISNIFKDYPYASIYKSKKEGFSLAVYSKFPIEKNAYIGFNSSDNSAMWVDIRVDNKLIRVFNCHLQTTNFNQTRGLLAKETLAGFYDSKKEAVKQIMLKMAVNAEKRAEQTDLICNIIDTTKHAMILCGDLNDTPASYSYYKIKEKLQDGFQSAGSGFESTFRYLHGIFRIDYIFHSKELTGKKYITPSFDFSDHNPVIMELSVKKE